MGIKYNISKWTLINNDSYVDVNLHSSNSFMYSTSIKHLLFAESMETERWIRQPTTALKCFGGDQTHDNNNDKITMQWLALLSIGGIQNKL